MLDAELFLQPGHLIRRAHQIAWAQFTERTKKFDLTPVQYSTLLVISYHPGIDATRLSEMVSFDRATIGSVVERLEGKGLVRRQTGAEDRRTKQMSLTALGAKLIAEVRPLAPGIADRIMTNLSDRERSQLLRLLGKLVNIGKVVLADRADSAHGEHRPDQAARRRAAP